MITLVFPTEEHKTAVWEYKEEFQKNGEHTAGGGNLDRAESYEKWLADCRAKLSKQTVPQGYVPATLYLAFNEENRLVGMIDVRHECNDYLFRYGGHIGYGVRKSERRKGYAKEMLRLALKEAKKLGLERVLITCNESNIGSRKTILSNGGQYENSVWDPEERETVERYWI